MIVVLQGIVARVVALVNERNLFNVLTVDVLISHVGILKLGLCAINNMYKKCKY